MIEVIVKFSVIIIMYYCVLLCLIVYYCVHYKGGQFNRRATRLIQASCVARCQPTSSPIHAFALSSQNSTSHLPSSENSIMFLFSFALNSQNTIIFQFSFALDPQKTQLYFLFSFALSSQNSIIFLFSFCSPHKIQLYFYSHLPSILRKPN